MWVREATKLTTCYQPSGIVGSTSWQLVLQISQVATDEMRGVALNGHFYQLSQHKQYLTISQIKGRNRHWAKKKSIPLANQNIFSVSFSIHPAICLPEKLTCRYPPCLVIVSLKKASFYALGQASWSLFAFSSILSKGKRRGPRIEKQKLKRLPLEYDINSCHTRLSLHTMHNA